MAVTSTGFINEYVAVDLAVAGIKHVAVLIFQAHSENSA